MKTWQELANGKDIKNIKAFVYTVANHLIIDESRKKRPASLEDMQETYGFDVKSGSEASAADAVDGALLLHLAKQLQDDYCQILLFRYIDNLAPREIYEITGESTNVISVRLNRAVKALQILVDKDKERQ